MFPHAFCRADITIDGRAYVTFLTRSKTPFPGDKTINGAWYATMDVSKDNAAGSYNLYCEIPDLIPVDGKMMKKSGYDANKRQAYYHDNP